VLPGEADRGPDVRDAGAAHDEAGVSVDRTVPHPAVLLVTQVTWTNDFTTQRRREFLDGGLIDVNLLGAGHVVMLVNPADGRSPKWPSPEHLMERALDQLG
jgi:hypothetical protein